MQNEMRKRMVATQLSMARERFKWWSGFYFTTLFGLSIGAIKSKRPAILAPLVPLTFLFGYQADLAKGDQMERILGIKPLK